MSAESFRASYANVVTLDGLSTYYESAVSSPRQGKTRRRRDPEERFWSKIERRGPSECWLWTASVSTAGYGHMWLGPKCVDSHVLAYALANGIDPAELTGRHVQVQHTCNHKLCCNPAHLRLGSPVKNTRDACRDGLIARKLNAAAALAIVEARRSGRLVVEIAGHRGLKLAHVRRVLAGGAWSAVTGIEMTKPTVPGEQQLDLFPAVA